MNLSKYLDLANHHADATPQDIRELCQKVKKYGFNSAFVNPSYITLARDVLGSSGAVGTVIAFPLGQETKDIKIVSAISYIKLGADELDVSINVGLFKTGEHESVLEEMKAIVTVSKETKKPTIVKFIIETGFLTDDEIKKASELVLESGADFVKTCSGMGPRGATLKDVELVKSAVGGKIKIKVAGGITNYKQALEFINAGADRIGTSHAVEIVEQSKITV
ncbi:MAG: deoxyribose-phosphate aldolase [Candidatus Blackburnbacteria bacterium]|nr:deoxyribose-phosphate aldolase [Candidatus Blackburnbacteria bacterium]